MKNYLSLFPFFFCMRYDTALNNQWPNICDEINSLNPINENELVKIVVNKLNNDDLIYIYVGSKFYRHDDIGYYKIKRSDKFKSDTHCIFIGIKILSDSKNKQKLLDESEKLISYFYNKYAEGTAVRNKLIIYDKTKTITDKDIEQLKDFQNTYRVKILLY